MRQSVTAAPPVACARPCRMNRLSATAITPNTAAPRKT